MIGPAEFNGGKCTANGTDEDDCFKQISVDVIVNGRVSHFKDKPD